MPKKHSVSPRVQTMLDMYYAHTSMNDIAKHFKTTPKYIKSNLCRVRRRLGLPPRKDPRIEAVKSFVEDRDIILQLLEDGISLRSLAHKYGISHTTAASHINEWLAEQHIEKEPLPEMSLADLYKDWADVTTPTLINVQRVPRFIVIPVGGHDEAHL
jgi:DNA-binding CsgD family transcriptional regulator